MAADEQGAGNAPALDLRGLPAPEPLVRALAAAGALAPGASVTVLTPLLPQPLLDTLAGQGYTTLAEPLAGGGARVRITRPEGNREAGRGKA